MSRESLKVFEEKLFDILKPGIYESLRLYDRGSYSSNRRVSLKFINLGPIRWVLIKFNEFPISSPEGYKRSNWMSSLHKVQGYELWWVSENLSCIKNKVKERKRDNDREKENQKKKTAEKKAEPKKICKMNRKYLKRIDKEMEYLND